MLISVAIPCYKSSKTIRSVVDEIRNTILNDGRHDYQIVLVNDYPFDETFDVISALCNEDPKIVGINLSRNFGQASAKLAAIPYVKGDILVYMDDDGQHPASGILQLAEKVTEGYDVVYAYFKSKKHSFFKRFTSALHAKVAEINGTRVKGIHGSSFLAISRFAVDSFKNYKSPFPSLMGYLNTLVGKTTEIELPHRARLEGTSNYTFKKLLKLWLNSFTNFSVVPLHAIAYLGALIAVLGFIFGTVIIVRKIFYPAMAAGYASTMSTLLFLGGLILIALGFIGEYIGRIYMTINNLQPYHIREVLNGSNDHSTCPKNDCSKSSQSHDEV